MSERFKTSSQAVVCSKQHNKPCGDCPWTNKSLPGWLGSDTVEDWLSIAHSDVISECHTRKRTKTKFWQCAGLATYRANVAKGSRDGMLKLPKDKEAAFASPLEFVRHHKQDPNAPLPVVMPYGMKDLMGC